VIASSGQTETQDSHPRQSAGLATVVWSLAASKTSAGQTSTHSPHDLHFSSSILGKYISATSSWLISDVLKNKHSQSLVSGTGEEYFATAIELVKGKSDVVAIQFTERLCN
jgi:hypothetical protein